MAIMEIKSVNVSPNAEDATIQVWQSFGWKFKSTQEVKTSDASHLESRADGSLWNVTKAGSHYIKLTFERDPEMKNHSELVELEQQYCSVPFPDSDKTWSRYPEPAKKVNTKWVMAALITIAIAVLASAPVMLIFTAVAVFLQIRFYISEASGFKQHLSYHQKYVEEYDIATSKQGEILRQARTLV